jgi:hypothetical protein
MRTIRVIIALIALLSGAAALAHKPSDSYLTLKVEDKNVIGQWDIALRDLDFAIGLDANGDADITWGEVKAKHNEIAAYALARLGLAVDGAECPSEAREHLIDNHSDGAYAVLRFAAECPKRVRNLDVKYQLFFDLDPQHKGLLNFEIGGVTRTAIFSADAASQTFQFEKVSRWRQFWEFVWEGVHHIWIGYDHILFLVSLLLPAVFFLQGRAWRPVGGFGEAFWDVFKIVTSFTVAHSITLSLAALDVVRLPSRLVESAIAASVVLAALNNIWPVVHKRRWVVAFLFGLIHGFGFASVLGDLGLPRNALVLALVGFNVGVELGQLAIVAAFLPVAYLLRSTQLYRRVVFVGGSLAIVLLAALWFVERAANMRIIST